MGLQKPAASNLSEGNLTGATAARPRVGLALLMRRKAAVILLDLAKMPLLDRLSEDAEVIVLAQAR